MVLVHAVITSYAALPAASILKIKSIRAEIAIISKLIREAAPTADKESTFSAGASIEEMSVGTT